MAESPVWKRPSDVMKNRRRKSVSRRITADADQRTSVIYKSPSKAKKRANPFLCSSERPTKRQNVDSLCQENLADKTTANHQLFDVLDTVDQVVQGPVKGANPEVLSQLLTNKESPTKDASPPREPVESNARNRRAKPQASSADVDVSEENTPLPYLPVDWSLKCKLRVVSSRPLNWCTQLKSSEEASGITGFVQNDNCEVESVVDQKKLFQQSCMYWIHPSLPWARLFPRIIDDSKHNISFVPLLNDIVQKSLQTDWEQSFTSVYYQLRTGLCPYFYLCTHQLTVMFYHDADAQSGPVAMITPTTRGFRELLETEGISFTLPVGAPLRSPGKTSEKKSSPEKPEESYTGQKRDDRGELEEEGDDLLETDDAASGWLESMGLDKKEFPSLDPRKVKLQREGFRVIDNRPESLVYVSGADVQALFNFLLNCRSCTAMSGAQAGIPPTILSTKAFKGATLKSHKTKHTAVKQSDRDGNISHAHIVEVTGPIMPSHCQALVKLFHKTQAADFGTVYNNHDPTIPFNILPSVLNRGKCRNCRKRDLGNRENKSPKAPASDSERTITDEENQKGETDASCDFCKTTNSEKENSEKTNSEKDNALSKHVPISNRLCAIKEFVCTKEGFTSTT